MKIYKGKKAKRKTLDEDSDDGQLPSKIPKIDQSTPKNEEFQSIVEYLKREGEKTSESKFVRLCESFSLWIIKIVKRCQIFFEDSQF